LHITEYMAEIVTRFIGETGYITLFIGMVLESMMFPLPSEAILPFSGFLIEEGKFTFPLAICIATLGSLVGSTLSYLIGYYLGKPFIAAFGKYFLIQDEDMEMTERYFQKNGELTIFVSRFIPVVRHLISIPAGIAKMDFRKFFVLTLIGAGLWNSILTYVGYRLKQKWQMIMAYSKQIDIVVVALLVTLIALYVYRHLRRSKKPKIDN
jgi:membrane protein DedA with SNARE-associated domain